MRHHMANWHAATAFLAIGLAALGAAAQDGGPAEDIRDIRGAIAVPQPPPWGVYAALAAAALLVLYGIVRIFLAWRRRPVDPYDAAKVQLAAVAEHTADMPPDRFAEAASQAVRDYMEACFPLRAAHRTSEELLQDLVSRIDTWPELSRHRPLVQELLTRADEAKFAAASLQAAQLGALHGTAVTLVDGLHQDYLARQKRSRKKRASRPAQAEGVGA